MLAFTRSRSQAEMADKEAKFCETSPIRRNGRLRPLRQIKANCSNGISVRRAQRSQSEPNFDGPKPILCAQRSALAGSLRPRSTSKPGCVRARPDYAGLRRRSGRRREAPLEGARFDCLLQLLEGAHLDLADALAGDAELLRQVLEGRRVVLEPSLPQDVPLALGQQGHRLAEKVPADAELLALAEP